MIALDTNLLVYAHRSRTPEHVRARKAIERAAADDAGWSIAVPSLAEFWAEVWPTRDLRARFRAGSGSRVRFRKDYDLHRRRRDAIKILPKSFGHDPDFRVAKTLE